MKTLVVYDSAFGNTKKVVDSIAMALQAKADTETISVADIAAADLARYDVVFLGSPTQGGQPTDQFKDFLNTLSSSGISGRRFAVFDTRFAMSNHGFGLRVLMKTIGFAAPKIASQVMKKGGVILVPPEGFIVNDTEGPLADGELERAAEWALNTLSQVR